MRKVYVTNIQAWPYICQHPRPQPGDGSPGFGSGPGEDSASLLSCLGQGPESPPLCRGPGDTGALKTWDPNCHCLVTSCSLILSSGATRENPLSPAPLLCLPPQDMNHPLPPLSQKATNAGDSRDRITKTIILLQILYSWCAARSPGCSLCKMGGGSVGPAQNPRGRR